MEESENRVPTSPAAPERDPPKDLQPVDAAPAAAAAPRSPGAEGARRHPGHGRRDRPGRGPEPVRGREPGASAGREPGAATGREARRDHRGSREERPFALDPDMPHPAHDPEIPVERLDPDAVKVISRLRHMGHQAYFVGGCVRDLLLGLKPKDFDIATDAHPGEVRAIFRNCRLIGRRFRLAHVYFRGGKIIEVATFRANPIDVADDVPGDADLLITRDNVFGTAEEDARRRDFTVNGLFYDPFVGEVLDYVGGRADLEAHRMATIGGPEVRIREDPVRSLRAIRFAARLGFAIEPETFAAMRRSAAELARCAPPRVLEETFKILRCGNSARAFELLRSAGALAMVLPALSQALDAGEAAMRSRFQAHLSALDALVRSGAEVSDAVLLGALLMHLRQDEPAGPGELPGLVEPGPPGDPGKPGANPADQLLAELVQTARLPRRMAERTRLAIGTQRVFRGPARRRRRRGGGLSAQAYFQDALQLLEMTVHATGEGAEALARWRSEGQARASAYAEAEAEGHGGEGETEGEGRPAAPRPPHRRERSPRLAHAEGVAAKAPARPGRGAPGGDPSQDGIPVVSSDARSATPRAAQGGDPGAHDIPVTSEPAEGAPRRRRRRRGGRRRRRRGVDGAAGAATEPSAGGA